jgi:hypothetical protein
MHYLLMQHLSPTMVLVAQYNPGRFLVTNDWQEACRTGLMVKAEAPGPRSTMAFGFLMNI